MSPHLQTTGIDLKLNKSTHTGPYHTEKVCSKPPSYPGSQDTLAEVVEGNTWILLGACGLVPEKTRHREEITLKSTNIILLIGGITAFIFHLTSVAVMEL